MRHTLSIVVADQPGELSRIVGLLARVVSISRRYQLGKQMTRVGRELQLSLVVMIGRSNRL